ncbi:MAG: bifunctional hydroxymethylpyrimidine kinase/phosphomethylpyrimidine kinase [Proteobacteria bacterium]|nr:bifunctional hydroxymethylpyrimidine kinase/phosphomethylpyrimidine kinase [Pseudomonadota bacterium]
MKRVLIIAGSDSSGGAGIQADIKTASAIGLYPLTVITAVTSQNTKGVHRVHFVPEQDIKAQLDAITDDIEFNVVKIGMLGDRAIAKVVLDFIKKCNKQVILDPVMYAQSGGKLSEENIFKDLIKYCSLVTPNYMEAQKITGKKINSLKDFRTTAKEIGKIAKRVLVKGGDSDIDYDIYYDGKDIYEFKIDRISTQNTHGTGCSLATAIAGYFALTGDYLEAIKKAREFVYYSLKNGIPLGSRFGTVDQFALLRKDAQRYLCIKELISAYEQLKNLKIGKILPEVQSNLVYSLSDAEDLSDVAGFNGRIISVGDDIFTPSFPVFGGSKHIGRVILSAKRFFPQLNSAMALRYEKAVIEKIKKSGFVVGFFDRKKEPKEIREKEGSSLDWGVTTACRKLKNPPDFIYDEGSVGKEPVIRLFGKNPSDIIEKIRKVKEFYF